MVDTTEMSTLKTILDNSDPSKPLLPTKQFHNNDLLKEFKVNLRQDFARYVKDILQKLMLLTNHKVLGVYHIKSLEQHYIDEEAIKQMTAYLMEIKMPNIYLHGNSADI